MILFVYDRSMTPLSLTATVRGEITITLANIPPMALEAIKSALTIANEEKEKAASIRQFGHWDMPDTIALWRIESLRGGEQVLCLPRGFAAALAAGLAGMGIDVMWDDQRTRAPAADGYYKIFHLSDERDYQLSAAMDMIKHEQGVIKAPAGSGKTVSTLLALAYAGQRALVIVDKVSLANQWRVRAHEFYDMPLIEIVNDDGVKELVAPLQGDRVVGLIGKGVWEERDLTICLRQTLHERAWQLNATGWWQAWGARVLDEVHHASGETLGDLSRLGTSVFLWGPSATPSKSKMKSAIVSALIGPVIHETPREVLYQRGILIQPTVEVLYGDFFANFHPDHDATFDKDTKKWSCQMNGCRKQGKHSHRNNYSSVLKAIVEDKGRNKRVAQRIMSERGIVHLVPSSQLKHLGLLEKAIVEAGWPPDKIWKLRGEENARGEDQLIAQQVADAGEAVILSTVAGEGLDIPPIARVHIVFPMRDTGATIQLCGRCERRSPNKQNAIIIDYREPLVDVLESQWSERDRTFRMQGYNMTKSKHSVLITEPEPEIDQGATDMGMSMEVDLVADG